MPSTDELKGEDERATWSFLVRLLAPAGIVMFALGFFINELARGNAYNDAYMSAVNHFTEIAADAGRAQQRAKAAEETIAQSLVEIDAIVVEVNAAKTRAEESLAAIEKAEASVRLAREEADSAKETAAGAARRLNEELAKTKSIAETVESFRDAGQFVDDVVGRLEPKLNQRIEAQVDSAIETRTKQIIDSRTEKIRADLFREVGRINQLRGRTANPREGIRGRVRVQPR